MAGVPYNPLMRASAAQAERPKPNSIYEALQASARQATNDFNSSAFSQSMSSDVSAAANSIYAALMAPGDAMRGNLNSYEIDPNTGYTMNTGLMDAATNMAGVVQLGSLPLPRPASSLGIGSGLLNWLGESQIKTPSGDPLRVYHGTTGNFDTFRIPKDAAGNERAVYFSPDPEIASQYAAGKGSVMPAYVRSDKLLTVDLQGGAVDALGRSRESIVRQAREQGYDAVLLRNTNDAGGIQDQYAILNATQIKSAIGNNGSYNPADPNIVRISGVPIISGDSQPER